MSLCNRSNNLVESLPPVLNTLESLSNAISLVNLGDGSYFSWGIILETSISWEGSDRLASPNFTLKLEWWIRLLKIPWHQYLKTIR